MVVVLKKNLKLMLFRIILVNSLFLFSIFSSLLGQAEVAPAIQFIQDTTQNIMLKLNETSNCQTLSHLSHHHIRNWVISYKQNDRTEYYKQKIHQIGHTQLESLFNQIIEKEQKYKNAYHVFYHGQKREFMLLQDLFAQLYKLKYKKALTDFIMLRIPDDADLKKYPNIKKFLEEYDGIHFHDAHNPFRKLLLSVNPSLFGNSYSYQDAGLSSTFYFFINSRNCSRIDLSPLIKDTFDYFGMSSCYQNHQEEFDELLQLLSEEEQTKTGLTIQIFVPKDLVDTITYKAYPGGEPTENPIIHSPATELEQYKQESFIKKIGFDTLDGIQFRLLMHTKYMLNPKSGIKFFRYYNETKNICLYQEKLQLLISQIENEI